MAGSWRTWSPARRRVPRSAPSGQPSRGSPAQLRATVLPRGREPVRWEMLRHRRSPSDCLLVARSEKRRRRAQPRPASSRVDRCVGRRPLPARLRHRAERRPPCGSFSRSGRSPRAITMDRVDRDRRQTSFMQRPFPSGRVTLFSRIEGAGRKPPAYERFAADVWHTCQGDLVTGSQMLALFDTDFDTYR